MAVYQTEVPLSPQRVWDTLMDLARWPQWDDELQHCQGELVQGATIELQTGDDTTRYVVQHLEEPRRLVLRSSLFFGALVVTRTFVLEDRGNETLLTVSEEASGWLAWLLAGPLVDVEDLARSLTATAAIDDLTASPRELPDLAVETPTLVEDFVVIRPVEPNLYYRRSGSGVDEAGGGLGAWDVAIYRLHEGHFVPHGVVDDGGYDAWGEGREEQLVFKEPPPGLTDLLVLPAVLSIFDADHDGLLVRADLIGDVEHEPCELVDAFGQAREGYVRVPTATRSLARAEEAARAGASLVWVHLPGDAMPRALVRRSLGQRWAADGLTSLGPVEAVTAVDSGPTCFTHLDDWQAGRATVSRGDGRSTTAG